MLSKIRYYVSTPTLTSIYYAIFNSHLTYGCLIWGQKFNVVQNKITTLQNAALRLMFFKPYQFSTNSLYNTAKILKIKHFISLNNFLFAHDHFYNKLPKALLGTFKPITHLHYTRNSEQNCLSLPTVNTVNYGINSITYQSIVCWNYFVKIYRNKNLSILSKVCCKEIITSHYIKSYI